MKNTKSIRIPASVELKVGDKVRLWSELHGTVDGTARIVKGPPEYGVVIEVADDDGWQDCYVAFRGRRPFPKKQRKLGTPPYILRYHFTSLEKIS